MAKAIPAVVDKRSADPATTAEELPVPSAEFLEEGRESDEPPGSDDRPVFSEDWEEFPESRDESLELLEESRLFSPEFCEELPDPWLELFELSDEAPELEESP
jgi:hypothetical protein